MVKQKVVIKLSMDDQKKLRKALQTAVGTDGVISTLIDGDKIVVEGDGFDSVTLITALRKKVRYVELLSVTPSESNNKKKDDKPKDEQKSEQIQPHYYPVAPPCMYRWYAYDEVSHYNSSCNIM